MKKAKDVKLTTRAMQVIPALKAKYGARAVNRVVSKLKQENALAGIPDVYSTEIENALRASQPEAGITAVKRPSAFGHFDSAMARKINRLLKPHGLSLKLRSDRRKWGDRVEVTLNESAASA